MSNIYVVVYNHPSNEQLGRITIQNEITQGFLNNYNNWLYDVGDDPSFYCSNLYNTNLSWGICRPNIRNKIRPNDIVVFFCYNGSNQTYFLVGLATVEEKIKQTQIWTDNNYIQYQQNFNLLIRLNNGIWEHHEPLFNIHGQHKDWANRLASRFPNATFQYDEEYLSYSYAIQDNYVLFKVDQQDTCILNNPIPVANWEPGAYNENWPLNTDDSIAVRNMIFNETHRESLRVHPNNQGHVHIFIAKNEEELLIWKNNFINFLQERNNMD